MSHLVKTSKRTRYEKSPVGGSITDPKVFFNRRSILKALGSAALVGPYAAACGTNAEGAEMLDIPYSRPDVFPATRNEAYQVPESIERKELTAREIAGSHNNFYEFLAGRGGAVWKLAGDYQPLPWAVEVTGECNKPRTFDLDDLLGFDHEERIYHFRCVERWAMNVPWTGFPLSALLNAVEPTSNAGFVSLYLPESSRRDARSRCEQLVPLAVPRGAPDGRGHEPAGVRGHRCLWRPAGAPARGADPDGVPLEVRLQGPEGGGQDRADREAASLLLGDAEARVRVLVEHQPEPPASTLESGRVLLAR